MSSRGIVVDFEKFRSDIGLDDDTLKELYQGFLEEISEEKEKLLLQFAQKDYGRLAKTVHNLKGVSSSYRAANVYNRSLSLDTRLKKNDYENIDKIMDDLVSDINEACEKIINYFKL